MHIYIYCMCIYIYVYGYRIYIYINIYAYTYICEQACICDWTHSMSFFKRSCQGRPRPQPWMTAASPHAPSGSPWARDAFAPSCLRCQGRFGFPMLPGAWKIWKYPEIGTGDIWGYSCLERLYPPGLLFHISYIVFPVYVRYQFLLFR